MKKMKTKTSEDLVFYFKIEPGENVTEISRKLGQVPEDFYLSDTKYFNLPEGRRLVLIFLRGHMKTIEELLDGPLVCYFGSTEIK